MNEEDIHRVLELEPDAEVLPGLVARRALRRALLIPGEWSMYGA